MVPKQLEKVSLLALASKTYQNTWKQVFQSGWTFTISTVLISDITPAHSHTPAHTRASLNMCYRCTRQRRADRNMSRTHQEAFVICNLSSRISGNRLICNQEKKKNERGGRGRTEKRSESSKAEKTQQPGCCAADAAVRTTIGDKNCICLIPERWSHLRRIIWINSLSVMFDVFPLVSDNAKLCVSIHKGAFLSVY